MIVLYQTRFWFLVTGKRGKQVSRLILLFLQCNKIVQ